MTNAEKRYEKRANSAFKAKYSVKVRPKQKTKVILSVPVGRSVKKGDPHYGQCCTRSKSCRRKLKAIKQRRCGPGKARVRYVTNDGDYVCSRCYARIRRQLKKKQGKQQISEAERRKRIFASWKNPELDKLRRTEEYKNWRVAVLERDGYKCQHCEKTGGRLHAHHIKSFKLYPDLRYDVENGVTLCKKCHEDLHIANVYRKPFVIKLRA